MPQPTVEEIYHRVSHDDCDDAFDCLKRVFAGTFYEGFVACALELEQELENGAGRDQITMMLNNWIIECHNRTIAEINRITKGKDLERAQRTPAGCRPDPPPDQ
jgi:hypothetical protein